jgi:Acetyltransferase (GNAT) domain
MLQTPAANSAIKTQLLRREELETYLPAWHDLCGRAVEHNVYYSPQYALALLDNIDRNKDISFAMIWEHDRLIGMLPVTRAKLAIPLVGPSGSAWATKYTFSCTPLLDNVRKREAADALLAVLASIREGEWVIPTINTQGEACRVLISALGRRGSPWTFAGRFQRAALETGLTFDEHMQRHVSAKRRKDLVRNRRRLEQLGKVEHEGHRSGPGLARAVSQFLAIEAAGWKGKRGTALACAERTRKFALDAFTGDDNAICRADVLTLDALPIAVSLIALAGDTGFAVKCAYDETYRKCSVGLLLEVEVVRSFLLEKWARRLDGATAGPHVIDGLWSERIEVADFMFSLSSHRPEQRLHAVATCDRLKRSVRNGAKRALISLPGMLSPDKPGREAAP